MATGYVLLPASAWQPPDGTAGNAAPGGIVTKGTQTPAGFWQEWAFDAATDEHLYVSFEMPGDYASGGVLSIAWRSNDTGATENPIWAAQVGAITPGDADTPYEHAWSTAATVSDVVNATEANRGIRSTITLNMDSAAANDLITIHLYRDADAAGDDLSSDAILTAAGCTFSYTTS